MALMNSRLTNILKGVNTYPGFVNNSGGISSQQNPQHEVYTDTLSVNANDFVFVLKTTDLTSTQWIGIGCYDENGWTQRITPAISANSWATARIQIDDVLYYVAMFSLPSGTLEAKFSWRTYDSAEVFLTPASDLFQIFDYV